MDEHDPALNLVVDLLPPEYLAARVTRNRAARTESPRSCQGGSGGGGNDRGLDVQEDGL